MGHPGVGLFSMLIIGGLAGWIAGMIVESRHGILTNILVGIADMRARNISTRLCTTRVGSRRSGNTRARLSAKQRRRSAIARSITPPFEVRRPPSKAAVTFLA
jgi:hypothetical protein